ncbi:MAG: hypothetical protein H7A45_13790 [Verrucomicrobiales bacterium]|nr:hypothetical protein [Verrucomicrobiales bacterium]
MRVLLRNPFVLLLPLLSCWASPGAAQPDGDFIQDPLDVLERTCFQTGGPWGGHVNLRSDVAIVYGIDPGLPARVQTWRDRGYRIHVMTGVSWGNYQDYLYGRFDGTDHQDEAQTERDGKKISHGGDVYYMCPGANFGKFLCVGVQRALDAGAEAVHMEEPEFWVRGGYSEGFKREWRAFYHEDWQPPHRSVDAQWRASKLKYHLYRRALQQVFDHIQAYNRDTGRSVRCYVPTHSLLNYAHWRIVSPESSLARLSGCDGYIAQVWTGTSRTPNLYRGELKERTFETAFLEYGAMQNLVRSTGRRVWYLNDPIEDDPNHDWDDYRRNWESTLVASLLQPEVWRYEVMPWPNRIFAGKYPRAGGDQERVGIPPAYATEIQTVINALNDLNQPEVEWDCGTPGIGVLVSDSLMFQRGEPDPSDPHLSHIYGLALPFLKRGMPVAPVQLENVTIDGYLQGFEVLLLTYHGQKPLRPEVHQPLADWVRAGGLLVVWDDDRDPFNRVREWWNDDGRNERTPRQHLFGALGLADTTPPGSHPVGKGRMLFAADDPVGLARSAVGDATLVAAVVGVAREAGLTWRETNHLLLRRGPYLVAAGLDESIPAPTKVLSGRLVNLFDPTLAVRETIELTPGSRWFLLDLDRVPTKGPVILASAGKALPVETNLREYICAVEGIENTRGILLLRLPTRPQHLSLDDRALEDWRYDEAAHVLHVEFPNQARARRLVVSF